MNQSADFNSFESGEPIADDFQNAYRVRAHMMFIGILKRIFPDLWEPREHGAFSSMFEAHWNQVGRAGIKERLGKLVTLAESAAKNKEVNNPPAYFTKCAKELLK